MYAYGDGVDGGPVSRQFYSGSYFQRGWKQYELSNHLGNVLTTISDKKFGVSSGGVGSLIDYYEPDMVSANDYYPFGMLSRVATASTGTNYRYGFNGKENDNEVKGLGSQQDYGMRVYDPRVGRFLSVDPISKSYPMLTPYQFASNRPIDGIDQDGEEFKKYISYDIAKGQFNIHYEVKLKIVNCSQYSGDLNEVGQQLQKDFKNAFHGVYDSRRRINYSGI